MQKAVVSSSCLGATAILIIILSSWSLGMEELALSDPSARGG